ncbi:MAG: hypothetical protein KJO64_07110 [Bacteroidia bacterium]|nr:hypothetical protein [Bacteroidia bacterium]NNC85625.1 hypothetical protein [Bacteroidia bacterium]
MKKKSKQENPSVLPDQLKNMENDFDQFNIYSADYEKDFNVDYTNMDVLLGIINPLKYKKEQDTGNSELNSDMKILLNALHDLEECLIKAGPELKIRMSDFGIPEVKQCIQTRNFALLKENLAVVTKNIDTTVTTLVEYGFSAELRQKIANVNIDNYLLESTNREALQESDNLWSKLVIDKNNKRSGVFKSKSVKEKQS